MCQPRAEDSRPRHRHMVMAVYGVASAPRKFNALQCSSMRLQPQRNAEGIYSMAETTFDDVCWYMQEGNWGSETEGSDELPRRAEGGLGGGKPSLKIELCTVQAFGSQHFREASKRIKLRSSSVEVLHRGSGNLLAVELIICNSEGDRESLVALLTLQVATEHSVHPMAPRTRATPRRGHNYGQRGSSGGRGIHSPRRISPLACASPHSIELEDSGYAISNTVQSAKFKFRRRTNKPTVSALVTVIFSEEEEEEGSWKAETEEQTPPSSENSAQRKDLDDSSYSPSPQSRLEEDNTFAHSGEQVEMLKEIGSLKGKEPMEIAQPTTAVKSAMEVTKKASPQTHALDKEPDNSFANILYLKLPLGILRPEDIPDGMEVTWERDPDKEAEQSQKSLK